ncbi:MAG: hypothetical protein M0R32_11990 [Candidatus Cloacimonetes bacterium]|jgi:hypothetical protein|nr:hypothetical protein [Candidatus Cloacimonadota bacterium]
MLKIGLVGYSDKKFDKELAKKLVAIGLLKAAESQYDDEIVLVSGLTNLGIPAIGYSFAKEQGWKTVGIACSKASEYECFPVDEKHIIGDDWGEESETFLNSIDVLVRIGGGKQSEKEEKMAMDKDIPCFSFELPLQSS